jgi:3-deoxy-7-phosphoheptulonate synthase
MVQIAELGLPIATEALDPIVPQFLGDLVSWTAIGARTAESQTHREMASGLSTAVGFKNGTDGSVVVAINGIKSAARSHRFLGINQRGECSVVHTSGNPLGHLVLRGGKVPNYDRSSVHDAAELMRSAGIAARIMVDCSHGNSEKDYRRQGEVFRAVTEQVRGDPDSPIIGWMLESNLCEGRQELGAEPLRYGVSITDSCISWEQTEALLMEAFERGT